jgi:hypothetical protein
MKQRKRNLSSKLYDKYLRKDLNPEINNVKRIYLKFYPTLISIQQIEIEECDKSPKGDSSITEN